jgi:hypothetical protein
MNSFSAVLLAAGILLFHPQHVGFAWGGETHKRITYWAWKHSGLPASSGQAVVPVVWNMDSIEHALGVQGLDMEGYLMSVFAAATGASFHVDTSITVPAKMTDSALFYDYGRIPDDLDAPAEAAGGAQFGHMYIPAGGGFADGMCKFFFDKAVSAYKAKSRRVAYVYLALSSHYIEDVGFPPHNEKNYLDPEADVWQAAYHSEIETKIGDKAYWYEHFDDLCDSLARVPLYACNAVMAVHSLAWECLWYDQDFKDAAVKTDTTDLNAICRICLVAIVPRVAGLFQLFKDEVGLSDETY